MVLEGLHFNGSKSEKKKIENIDNVYSDYREFTCGIP